MRSTVGEVWSAASIDRSIGRQYLYSTDGDVIFFARYAFRRSDVKQLLAQLQLN